MSKRVLLSLVGLACAFCWVQLGLLVLNTSPDSPASRLAFFGLLFCGVWSAGGLAAYGLALRFPRQNPLNGDLWRAMLEGLPIAVLLTTTAYLQSVRALNLGIGLVLLVIAGMAQYVLLPRELPQKGRPQTLERLPGAMTTAARKRAGSLMKRVARRARTPEPTLPPEPNPKIIDIGKARAKKTKYQSKDSGWKSNK